MSMVMKFEEVETAGEPPIMYVMDSDVGAFKLAVETGDATEIGRLFLRYMDSYIDSYMRGNKRMTDFAASERKQWVSQYQRRLKWKHRLFDAFPYAAMILCLVLMVVVESIR